MERLTASPYVVNGYAFCGNSVLTEFAPATLQDKIRAKQEGPPPTSADQRLRWALDVAEGIYALHDIEGGPIVHADLQSKQFLVTETGTVKVNDFNRCRFLAHRNDTDATCTMHIPTAPGKARAPEEYRLAELDEKIDIYSAANIFYEIITGRPAWDGWSTAETKSLIQQGAIPIIEPEFQNTSTDQVLAELTERAYALDPYNRSSARDLVIALRRIQHKHANANLTNSAN